MELADRISRIGGGEAPGGSNPVRSGIILGLATRIASKLVSKLKVRLLFRLTR